jgi:hypothetical protein
LKIALKDIETKKKDKDDSSDREYDYSESSDSSVESDNEESVTKPLIEKQKEYILREVDIPDTMIKA